MVQDRTAPVGDGLGDACERFEQAIRNVSAPLSQLSFHAAQEAVVIFAGIRFDAAPFLEFLFEDVGFAKLALTARRSTNMVSTI